MKTINTTKILSRLKIVAGKPKSVKDIMEVLENYRIYLVTDTSLNDSETKKFRDALGKLIPNILARGSINSIVDNEDGSMSLFWKLSDGTKIQVHSNMHDDEFGLEVS